MELNIKHIVKDRTVNFCWYRQGFMYYAVRVDNIVYVFPVPLDDVGQATLLESDKAIVFMRWIRKALEDGTFIKQ